MSDVIRDFAIDIESLGVHRGAAILSIGCVQFDRRSAKLGAEFYVEIELHSLLKSGEVDPSTLTWWAVNHGPLFAELLKSKETKVTFATALDHFAKWMRNLSAGIPVIKGSLGSGTPHVWGNGATMDISLLEEAYLHGGYGLTKPWDHRHIRDQRTIIDAAREVTGDPNWWPGVGQQGTSHNALDDARYQAKCVAEAFRVIRTGPEPVGDEEL